jgi:hypothetical protein
VPEDLPAGSNNGLRAYLEKAINGAISDAQQEWQSKGFSGFDTRLRRFLRSDRELSPEDLQKLLPNYTADQIAGLNDRPKKRDLSLEQIQKLFPKYTLGEIAQALEPIVMQSYGEGAVDDENGHQDADDHTAPSGYALAKASSDPVNAQRSTASQHSKRAALGPLKWTRRDNRPSLRNFYAYEKKPNKRVYGSPWVDALERHTAIRERALLEWVGRQRFTEWRMQHRSTANTGDWENGEWRSTERGRIPHGVPAPKVEDSVVRAQHFKATAETTAKDKLGVAA